ncbi:hypothetical protein [Herpetosiphon geysericola]|uniref:hypothetical protein n=1 Tax=Herpetosiphon geysericola TaxID=70996 RepID=UPI00191BFDD5|nr:hypothetical protein [Herpetosiphon geysericola]
MSVRESLWTMDSFEEAFFSNNHGGAVITHLPRLVAGLPPSVAALWRQLFRVDVSHGTIHPPDRMHGWIERAFGSVEAVLHQEIIRVTNLWTLEGAIFNRIRGLRPQQGRYQSDIDQIIAASAGPQDEAGFCTPESGTPEDRFGRVRGRYCLSASNVAKFDGWHGVLIFDQHNPLNFNLERVEDYIQTAGRWFDAVHSADPQAIYPFFIWNSLWRSGASVIHGHAQMSVSHGMAYPKVEMLRRTAEQYQLQNNSNYFQDVWRVHRALGLSLNIHSDNTYGFVSLTPVKEKEVVLFGNDPQELAQSLYHVLDCFVTELGVQSFNVSMTLPPLTDTPESWDNLPTIVRIVDRGDPNSRGSDIGAMELYAATVVASDPFNIANALAGRFPSR